MASDVRRRAFGAALLAGLTLVPAVVADTGTARTCGRSTDVPALSAQGIRVVRDGAGSPQWIACSGPSRHPRRVRLNDEITGDDFIDGAQIIGHRVAFVEHQFSDETPGDGPYGYVMLVDVRTGRRTDYGSPYAGRLSTPFLPAGSVARFAFGSGRLAWVGCAPAPDDAPGGRRCASAGRLEVVVARPGKAPSDSGVDRRATRLARSRGIVPKSLRISGGRVRWVDGGRRHSARFPN